MKLLNIHNRTQNNKKLFKDLPQINGPTNVSHALNTPKSEGLQISQFLSNTFFSFKLLFQYVHLIILLTFAFLIKHCLINIPQFFRRTYLQIYSSRLRSYLIQHFRKYLCFHQMDEWQMNERGKNVLIILRGKTVTNTYVKYHLFHYLKNCHQHIQTQT